MKMTLKTLILGLIAGTFFFSCKKNDNHNMETLSAQDQTFINQASASNTAEIRIGGMADSTADSSAIRVFGGKLMGDYQTAQNDLKSLGQTVKFNVSDSLDAAHMLRIDTLMGLTGRAFDSVFLLRQIQDHNAAIVNYQNEINSGNRSQVVQYASKYLPKIQMHLNTADSLATAMGFK